MSAKAIVVGFCVGTIVVGGAWALSSYRSYNSENDEVNQVLKKLSTGGDPWAPTCTRIDPQSRVVLASWPPRDDGKCYASDEADRK